MEEGFKIVKNEKGFQHPGAPTTESIPEPHNKHLAVLLCSNNP